MSFHHHQMSVVVFARLFAFGSASQIVVLDQMYINGEQQWILNLLQNKTRKFSRAYSSPNSKTMVTLAAEKLLLTNIHVK